MFSARAGPLCVRCIRGWLPENLQAFGCCVDFCIQQEGCGCSNKLERMEEMSMEAGSVWQQEVYCVWRSIDVRKDSPC
jgi:hypothetical protein